MTKAHQRRPFNLSNGQRTVLFHVIGILWALTGSAFADSGLSPPSRVARALTRAAPTLVWDASLSKAAEHHARDILSHPRKARLDQVKDALAREGVADATVLPFARSGKPSNTWMDAARRFAQAGAQRGFNRLGFARQKRSGRTAWVVLLTRRLAALSPLPPQSGPRGIYVVGRVIAPYEMLLLSPCSHQSDCPEGRITQLASGSAGALAVHIPPLAREHRHVLELLVFTERGPEIAALWTFGARWPTPKAASHDRQEDLFALLVDARRRAQVAPVTAHQALGRAAHRHAQAVCAQHVAAHVFAHEGNPTDRARAVGYRGRVSENIAVAADARQAHQNLMWSPGHRRVRLDPTAVHVGQAVVLGIALEGFARPICVVEVFGRPLS